MSKKLQEKQRRRLAEEARRAQQRRASRRSTGITVAIALVVAALVVVLIVREQSDTGAAAAPEGVAAAAAGCGDIEEHESAGRQHVDDGTDVQYETSPPTSGDHYGTPADAAFYSSEVAEETLVHNLEHGQIVIWYRPDASDEDEIEDLEAYVDAGNGAVDAATAIPPLVAAPFDGLDDGADLAITAWTRSQTCADYSRDALDAFRRRFQGRGPEALGVPPFSG